MSPPQHGEVAGLEHQHPVAGRQRVDERRLPRAGAGRGIDHDGAGGLKDPLQAVEHLAPEPRERRAAVIDGRLRDGAQNPVRHVGRPGDLEKMTAGHQHVDHNEKAAMQHAKDTERHEKEEQQMFAVSASSAVSAFKTSCVYGPLKTDTTSLDGGNV